MTLQTYDAESFEELASRLVEVSGKFREMAKQQKQSGLKPVKLNARKLQEWFDYIEIWAQAASGRQLTESLKQRGAQRAAKAKRKKS